MNWYDNELCEICKAQPISVVCDECGEIVYIKEGEWSSICKICEKKGKFSLCMLPTDWGNEYIGVNNIVMWSNRPIK